ncbi:MAG: nicotinate (nicotinamide) nucleotide adenylyltransferase [Natronospirillum sp.]
MDIIYGGSFDPPHKGHERFVELMLARFPNAAVHLLPCFQSVQKGPAHATAENRLGMVQAMAHQWPGRVRVDSREIAAAAPKPTIDTLVEWRQEMGREASLVFALGGDSLARLDTWVRWTELLEWVHLLVLPRPGWDHELPPLVQARLQGRWLTEGEWDRLRRTAGGHALVLPGKALPFASSEIRQSRAKLADAVPESVLNYIEQNELFR